MNKELRRVLNAADNAVTWMKDATLPNEVNHVLRELTDALNAYRKKEQSQQSGGSLLALELNDGRRRITATIEQADRYISRTGWAALGVDAEVFYSVEVENLDEARRRLKETLSNECWGGQGMEWCHLSRKDLMAAIKTVVEKKRAARGENHAPLSRM